MIDNGWMRLSGVADERFRFQRAALIEYARAILPTRYSRRVVGPSGEKDPSSMPSEIWLRDDDFAFVWRVRHPQAAADTESPRIVGRVRRVPGKGYEILPFDPAQAQPEAWDGVERIDLADQFWRSDSPQPSPAAAATTVPESPAAAPSQQTEPTPDAARTSVIERAREARETIDKAVARLMAKETALPLVELGFKAGTYQPGASEWRPQRDRETRKQVELLLDRAKVCNFRFDAASERIVLLERDAPFYRGCRLFRVIDMRGPRSRFASFVLHLESADIACLAKQSPPIHEFNERRLEREELVIDGTTAGAYARFFCEFVQGEAGAFSIIERHDEIRWLYQPVIRQHASTGTGNEPSTEELQAAIGTVIEPVAFYLPRFGEPVVDAREPATGEPDKAGPPMTPPSSIYCRALVGYGRYLFFVGLAVRPSGMIDMLADVPLHAAPLPIQPLSFNIEFQFQLRVDVSAEGVRRG